MSHDATNWAIKQRGLEPASKLLLWQLADRHNRDTGRCDPSQERLADDCEMSRASVNRHLQKLEEAGLIRRVQRINNETRRQERTSYLLAFDNDFSESQNETRAVSQIEPEPCLKSGESRVSNCDTNPVREPGSEPTRAPAREAEFDRFWAAHPKPRSRERCERLFDEAVEKGTDPAVIVAAAERYRRENAGTERRWIAHADNWLDGERWKDHEAAPRSQGSTPGNPADFWAEKILAGRYVPSSAVSASVAQEIVERELLTRDQLRRVGVAI